MNLDFTYQNPTTIYFGKNALDNLSSELANYGDTIMLAYGKGAIKKSGLYDQVVSILKESGKNIVELAGIMANPTYNLFIASAASLKIAMLFFSFLIRSSLYHIILNG